MNNKDTEVPERERWFYISAWGDNKPTHITKSTSKVLHQGGTHVGLCGEKVLGVDGYAVVLNGHEQSPVCAPCKSILLELLLSAYARVDPPAAPTEAKGARKLTLPELNHLSALLEAERESGEYAGPREEYYARTERLIKWCEDQIGES